MMGKKYVGRYRPARNKWAHQRTKLQRASDIARSMEKTNHVIWSNWPYGHCLTTCLVFAPIVRVSLEWEVDIAIGRVGNNHPHAWISSPEDDLLDLTHYFDGGPPLRVLPARANWVLGHWPEVHLTRAQEQQLLAGLKPHSEQSGWTQECGAIAVMRDHPLLSPLLR